jgi:hypothetical protein
MRMGIGCAATVMVCAAGTAMAAVVPPTVDFETLPASQLPIPREGTVITDQYWGTSGIRFSSQTGARLVVAKAGAPQMAFTGYDGLADTPQPGATVGEYFLTDETADTTPGPFEVEYRWPVQVASAVFMDVNGQEAWKAEAFDAQGQSRGQITIWPTPSTGSAVTWSLDVGSAVITKVKITFVGTAAPEGVTFAFDNFRGSRPVCAADINGDGTVDFGDFLAFTDAFSRSEAVADLTGDGMVTFEDYLAFMTAFDTGC